jgi:hypothetical protein
MEPAPDPAAARAEDGGTAEHEQEPDATVKADAEKRDEVKDEPQERTDAVKRLVAILIMVVTLLGAGTAYLRTVFGDRAARADRLAQPIRYEHSPRSSTQAAAPTGGTRRRTWPATSWPSRARMPGWRASPARRPHMPRPCPEPMGTSPRR